MEKGLRKAMELGWKMLKWTEENELFGSILVQKEDVEFDCQGKSYKNIHLFKKVFPEVGKLNREVYLNDALRYKGEVGKLKIDFYAVRQLPPSCKLITEEVTIAEELIPEHTEPEHIETVTKIVCGNGEQTEETEALLNEN